MRTDELIVQLARSAKPRRPLPSPALRTVQWAAVALLVMGIGVVIIGPRHDLSAALARPHFFGSLAALLFTLASGAFSAFVLSVPGAERSPLQRVMPLLAAAAWSAIWLIFLVAGESAGRPTRVIHSACVIQIAVCALATGWILMTMLARAAPLRPMWTAAVASLASMATGAALAQILCPVDDTTHHLVGHVAIALVVASVSVLVASPMFRSWRGSSR